MGRHGTKRKTYKKQTYIMKDPMIYNQWTQLMNQHPLLFQTNEESWMATLEELHKYITTHDSLPSTTSKDPTEKQLGVWVGNQKTNYKKQTKSMKDPMIYNQWTQLMNQHPLLFQTNEDQWMETLEQLQQYITTHNSLPSAIQKTQRKNISIMGRHPKDKLQKANQHHDRPNDSQPMDPIDEQHPLLFQTNEESWMATLEQLQQFIEPTIPYRQEFKRPNGKTIRINGSSTQKKNYKKQTQIMTDPMIYNQWTQLMNQHPLLFQTREVQWMETLEQLQQYIDHQ